MAIMQHNNRKNNLFQLKIIRRISVHKNQQNNELLNNRVTGETRHHNTNKINVQKGEKIQFNK